MDSGFKDVAVKYLLATAILALGTTGVAAQDGTDWSGFYAGVGISAQRTSTHVQAGDLNTTLTTNPDGFLSPTLSSSVIITDFSGIMIDSSAPSLLAGYGMQLDKNLYVGVEGEYDFGDPVVFNSLSDITCTAVLCIASTNEASLQTMGRVRAVFGAAPDQNFLLFGTAGVAIGKGSVGAVSVATVNGVQTDNDDEGTTGYLIGATFGAGVEVKATPNLIFRLEGAIDTYPTAVQGTTTVTTTADDGSGHSATEVLGTDGSATFTNAMVRAAALWQF